MGQHASPCGDMADRDEVLAKQRKLCAKDCTSTMGTTGSCHSDSHSAFFTQRVGTTCRSQGGRSALDLPRNRIGAGKFQSTKIWPFGDGGHLAWIDADLANYDDDYFLVGSGPSLMGVGLNA